MQNISDYGVEFISSYDIDHLRNSIFGLSFRKRYIENFKLKHWPMLYETFSWNQTKKMMLEER